MDEEVFGDNLGVGVAEDGAARFGDSGDVFQSLGGGRAAGELFQRGVVGGELPLLWGREAVAIPAQ